MAPFRTPDQDILAISSNADAAIFIDTAINTMPIAADADLVPVPSRRVKSSSIVPRPLSRPSAGILAKSSQADAMSFIAAAIISIPIAVDISLGVELMVFVNTKISARRTATPAKPAQSSPKFSIPSSLHADARIRTAAANTTIWILPFIMVLAFPPISLTVPMSIPIRLAIATIPPAIFSRPRSPMTFNAEARIRTATERFISAKLSTPNFNVPVRLLVISFTAPTSPPNSANIATIAS